jgi:hypothetical protein
MNNREYAERLNVIAQAVKVLNEAAANARLAGLDVYLVVIDGKLRANVKRRKDSE